MIDSINTDPRPAVTNDARPQRPSFCSRRNFLTATAATAGGLLLAQSRLFGQSAGVVEKIQGAAATDAITVTKVRGNLSVLSGSGGNIAVLTGPDGKLLVDAGISVSQARVRAALDALSGDPIRHLINSHWHFDHTSGNDWLHEAGATITSHVTTRRRLSVKHRVEGWRFNFPAAPSGALPSVVFKNDLEMHVNDNRILLQYYEPAHTDCDISVYFPDADVLHVADTCWTAGYPFTDYSSGGTIDGCIDAASANVQRVTGDTIVVPGHGPVGGRADLIEFRDMLVAVREKVSALKEKGLTLEETVAQKPTAPFDPRWGRFVITPDAFTALVYQGV